MKPLMSNFGKILLAVVMERIARHAVDQYLMPLIERVPTRRRKPFGFSNARR